MNKKILIIVTSLLAMSALNAQGKWSLQECIDHALNHNIEIKQQELDAKYQENNYQQAKDNRLPDLNAGVAQSFGFGRSMDVNDVYTDMASSNTGFSLSSNAVLWRGGTLKNTIKQQEFELKSSYENLEKVKDDITINIAKAYLEILLAQEVMEVAEQQVGQTQIQIERTQKLVDAGKVAAGALLDIKAQESREALEVVNAENGLTMALLNLSQVLELDDYASFGVQEPVLPEMQAEFSLLTARLVFESAVKNRPEIKSAEYKLESSNTQLKIAQAGRLPSLTISAGFYDQYNKAFDNSSGVSFVDQMEANKRSNLGLNLNVPIFNRFETRSSIQNAEIQIESRRLALESTKKELRRQIEQSYINAMAAFQRYNANKIAVESMEESFRYMETKFELGRVNTVEYNDTKTRLASAQSDLVQAKYEFIFRSKILDFYNGVEITL